MNGQRSLFTNGRSCSGGGYSNLGKDESGRMLAASSPSSVRYQLATTLVINLLISEMGKTHRLNEYIRSFLLGVQLTLAVPIYLPSQRIRLLVERYLPLQILTMYLTRCNSDSHAQSRLLLYWLGQSREWSRSKHEQPDDYNHDERAGDGDGQLRPIPSYVVTVNTDSTSGVAAHCPAQPSAESNVNCSLRDALAAAAAGTTGAGNITFDKTIFATAQTIQVLYFTLNIPSNTTITGRVAAQIR